MSYVPKYLSESSSMKHVIVDLKLEGVATKKRFRTNYTCWY